jgi:hypothetical protein
MFFFFLDVTSAIWTVHKVGGFEFSETKQFAVYLTLQEAKGCFFIYKKAENLEHQEILNLLSQTRTILDRKCLDYSKSAFL